MRCRRRVGARVLISHHVRTPPPVPCIRLCPRRRRARTLALPRAVRPCAHLRAAPLPESLLRRTAEAADAPSGSRSSSLPQQQQQAAACAVAAAAAAAASNQCPRRSRLPAPSAWCVAARVRSQRTAPHARRTAARPLTRPPARRSLTRARPSHRRLLGPRLARCGALRSPFGAQERRHAVATPVVSSRTPDAPCRARLWSLAAVQAGLNIMAFCKEFNARTQGFKARSAARTTRRACTAQRRRHAHAQLRWLHQDDVPLPVLVTAYKDKTFAFVRRGTRHAARGARNFRFRHVALTRPTRRCR